MMAQNASDFARRSSLLVKGCKMRSFRRLGMFALALAIAGPAIAQDDGVARVSEARQIGAGGSPRRPEPPDHTQVAADDRQEDDASIAQDAPSTDAVLKSTGWKPSGTRVAPLDPEGAQVGQDGGMKAGPDLSGLSSDGGTMPSVADLKAWTGGGAKATSAQRSLGGDAPMPSPAAVLASADYTSPVPPKAKLSTHDEAAVQATQTVTDTSSASAHNPLLTYTLLSTFGGSLLFLALINMFDCALYKLSWWTYNKSKIECAVALSLFASLIGTILLAAWNISPLIFAAAVLVGIIITGMISLYLRIRNDPDLGELLTEVLVWGLGLLFFSSFGAFGTVMYLLFV